MNGKVEWEGNKVQGFNNDVIGLLATKFGFDYQMKLSFPDYYSLKKKKWMGTLGEVDINCH